MSDARKTAIHSFPTITHMPVYYFYIILAINKAHLQSLQYVLKQVYFDQI